MSQAILNGLIALRSGSKSIPDKNIRMFHEKPLFYWAAKAALDSGIFNGGLYIAVDSQRYSNIIHEWLPDANVIFRPDYTATDEATVESLMLWFVEEHPCDILSLIQVTTPTVTPEDFQTAYRQFLDEKSDSLVTGVPFHRFIWKKSGIPINYDPVHRPRRQEFDDNIMENGSFYFTKTAVLKKHKSRLAGKISVYVMKDETGVEIDEPEDWEEAEKAFKQLRGQTQGEKGKKNLKVIVIDIDGTLTDGGMYYSSEGEHLKKFNTRDGAAIVAFRKLGWEIIVCTAESSPPVQKRMEKLQIQNYFQGISDKVAKLEKWMRGSSYSWDNIVFVGDGPNDLDIIRKSGLSFCPQDAHPFIKDAADIVLQTNGGDGVLQEILLLIEGKEI
ncbi:cytidylyltransferase domain-containing protein [Marispirochaeta aestuarii]|uniref:cytidylyltransferase domain-containing protein n=1 Tax=Marispirochaeta aestuarii TaxID=1963862 RepID=UPI0029C7FD2C|nr:HAD hydrolase family protein [Marispirochaeta aestuarii]